METPTAIQGPTFLLLLVPVGERQLYFSFLTLEDLKKKRKPLAGLFCYTISLSRPVKRVHSLSLGQTVLSFISNLFYSSSRVPRPLSLS